MRVRTKRRAFFLGDFGFTYLTVNVLREKSASRTLKYGIVLVCSVGFIRPQSKVLFESLKPSSKTQEQVSQLNKVNALRAQKA